MKYYSLNKKSPSVSFKQTVIKGLAPDNGLYFPEKITPLDSGFINHIEYFSNEEIAFEVIKQFVGDEIPENTLKQIIKDTLNFDFPVIELDSNLAVLELFNGPTMAFKDVGARFMARCLGYFNSEQQKTEVTVLVATSGDTGGAVASGFLGVEGVKVVILYPSKMVSEVQEKQLTTLGKNITALEVSGTFDDCQDMVKKAFVDTEICNVVNLTSANSINTARWLPQMFYYFFAYKQLKNKHKELVFSVPSGNFGNICAGLMAYKLGLPIDHFIAATNANNIVPEFMKTGKYMPKPSVQTISNAMDVGNPSNFIRILEIFNHSIKNIRQLISAYSFSDEQTKQAILELYLKFQYVPDPHGAVAYLGLKEYLKNHNQYGIFLETAHPVKFLDIIKPLVSKEIPIPTQIQEVINKKKESICIANYNDLKEYLIKS